jgi:hypothetical protein
VENLTGFVVLPTTTTSLAAWFVADPISGAILIDNCTSLDAAIQARQQFIARVQSAVRRNARPEEADSL